MLKIIDIDRHNKESVRWTIKKRGQAATVGNLQLYYSDDRTLHDAIRRSGVAYQGCINPLTPVVLK